MKKPLRIGLVATYGYDFLGGVEYIKNIVFALSNLSKDVRSTFEICLICRKSSSALYDEARPHVDHVYFLDTALGSPTIINTIHWIIAFTLFNNRDPSYHGFLKKAQIDFVFPHFEASRRRRTYRSAAWIPDCQHKYLTQFFSEQEIQSRDKDFTSVAKYASVIAFSSKNAEKDFREFFYKGKYEAKILFPRVYPLPVWYEADPIKIQENYHLPDRFFFINNQFWQHKNHRVVFEALKILSDREINPAVVCTGCMYDYRNPTFLDTTLQTINRLGIAHQIYLLGIIPRIDMIGLLRRSIAMVQPSLFEGWSTVVEEASCLGKPIILSDIPIHIEQTPSHGILFKSNSAEDLSHILANSWQNLEPGPESSRESIARNLQLAEIQAFGYRFLNMARG